MSRCGCSLPANASGFDPHRASVTSRFGQVVWHMLGTGEQIEKRWLVPPPDRTAGSQRATAHPKEDGLAIFKRKSLTNISAFAADGSKGT
jgi:hypothetical protein|eukprot:COSAG01_NODE_8022_length_2950_cov_4.937215_1_plen_90_part_00